MTVHASPPGLSVWERDLLAHMTNHLEEENALLEEYRTLVAGIGLGVGLVSRGADPRGRGAASPDVQ